MCITRFPDDSVNPDYVTQLDKENGNYLPKGGIYGYGMNHEVNQIIDVNTFNPYIFFSRLYIFVDKELRKYGNVESLYDNNHYINYQNTINGFIGNQEWILHEFEKRTNEKPHVGDCVIFIKEEVKEYQPNYNDHIKIWDGSFFNAFQYRPKEIDEFGVYPPNIVINDYPHSEYFKYSTGHKYVQFKFTDRTYTQLPTKEKINLWRTDDGWTIVSFSDFTDKIFSGRYKIQKQEIPIYKFRFETNQYGRGTVAEEPLTEVYNTFLMLNLQDIKSSLESDLINDYERLKELVKDYETENGTDSNYYKFVLKHLSENVTPGVIKRILSELPESSKILINPIDTHIINTNVQSLKIYIDGKIVKLHDF
jgi:hypothetical protein